MDFDKKNLRQKGLADILGLIGMAILVLAIPLAVKLVEQRQELRRFAQESYPSPPSPQPSSLPPSPPPLPGDYENWRCPGPNCDKCAGGIADQGWGWWVPGCQDWCAAGNCPKAQTPGQLTPCYGFGSPCREGETKCDATTGYKEQRCGNDGCYRETGGSCQPPPTVPPPTPSSALPQAVTDEERIRYEEQRKIAQSLCEKTYLPSRSYTSLLGCVDSYMQRVQQGYNLDSQTGQLYLAPKFVKQICAGKNYINDENTYYDCKTGERVWLHGEMPAALRAICQTPQGLISYEDCLKFQSQAQQSCIGVDPQEEDTCFQERLVKIKEELDRQEKQSNLVADYCGQGRGGKAEEACNQRLTKAIASGYSLELDAQNKPTGRLYLEESKAQILCALTKSPVVQDDYSNWYDCSGFFPGKKITEEEAQNKLGLKPPSVTPPSVGPEPEEITNLAITGKTPEDFCKEENRKTNNNAFGTFFQFKDSDGQVKTAYCWSFDPNKKAEELPAGYYSVITSFKGLQIAVPEEKEVFVYSQPVDKSGADDKELKEYCRNNPYGQFKSTVESEWVGQQIFYGRCLPDGNYKWVSSPYADLAANEIVACSGQDGCPQELATASQDPEDKKKIPTGAYIRDADVYDGLSNNFLKLLAGKADHNSQSSGVDGYDRDAP